jgi:hypothetical protein
MMRRAIVTAAFAVLLGLITSAPSYADGKYVKTGSSPFNFASSNSAAIAKGTVQWYKGDRSWRPDIQRGEYERGSYVQLDKKGCVYAQIQWNYVTGTASLPPAGSASVGTTGDGWWQKCGGPGTQISLAGQNHEQVTLSRTCVSVGYSANSKEPRSYQSTHCYNAA